MTQPDQTASRESFLEAMRSVAASVTVITSDGPAGRAGATASSFTSVSADPPTVLVCLRAESRIAAAVSKNKKFCVNVLAQHHHHVADRFAGVHDPEIQDRFDGIDVASGDGEDVVLDGATTFACQVENMMTSGSHLVILGRVTTVTSKNNPPLTYLNGEYHRVVPHPHNADAND
jgi:flavin reductase (DIM6/NTAB) family NADH-FMN oxidoreductase RutF